MRYNLKKFSISIITIILLVAVFSGMLTEVVPTIASAAQADNKEEEELFDVYNVKVDKNTLVLLSQMESITMRLDAMSEKIESDLNDVEKKYNGIFKEKKTMEDTLEDFKDYIEILNNQLPGIIKMIKDFENGGDFSAANCIKTMVSTVSSICMLCGPVGCVIGAGLKLAETISMLALGGTAESSEIARLGNELELQFNDIKNELADLGSTMKNLSNELNDATNRIIEEFPAALEREDDRQQIRQFMLRYEGNFSYNQFRNYLYGETTGNSNASTAYSSWLDSALINVESDELIRRYYDDLYYALTNEIDDFEDYLAPGDDNIKSIVKTYYDYLSSNPDFISAYGMTPEEAAAQFAYELYLTVQQANTRITNCNTYQYTQMLLNGRDYYESYNGSFVVSKAQIEAMSSTIEARENNISLQLAKDMAYIAGMNRSYLLEETNNEFYYIHETEDTFGNVYAGQTVYLNQMPDGIHRLFNFDADAFSYTVNSVENGGYFMVDNTSAPVVVELKYEGQTIQTTTFRQNTASNFTGGTGTPEDPYLISTKDQFLRINEALDKHYILTRDIDMGGTTINPFGFSLNENGGESIEEFTGTLNGNGFTVSNLNILGRTCTGLFSIIGEEGFVGNLTLKDITVKATPGNAQSSNGNSYFHIGAFAGENYGKITYCNLVRDRNITPDATDITFKLDNTALNQNLYVHAGGIAGTNHNFISFCNVENIRLFAESKHSFAGENTATNKNHAYAGGSVGCNNGSLGYVTVNQATEIKAVAHSTLSPDDTVNPYVSGFAGGICGTFDSSLPNEKMAQLHTSAQTYGNADFSYVDSNWGKYYDNRKQNASNETNCYVPGWSSDRVTEASCDPAKITGRIEAAYADYCIEIGNITSAYRANDPFFDTSSMTVSVINKSEDNAICKISDHSALSVYGFMPFNESFDITLEDREAVVLVKITLEDGTTLVTRETVPYSIGKNGIDFITIEQQEKQFLADPANNPIPYSELSGSNNVTYHYLVGSATRSFDHEKFVAGSVITTNRITCENCGNDNVLTALSGNAVCYTCMRPDCAYAGTVTGQHYDFLYKGTPGQYTATVCGQYDGAEVVFAFNYAVACPHTVYETDHLQKQTVVTPTCLSIGYTVYECNLCHETVQADYMPKTLTHRYETVAGENGLTYTAPTCYRDGFTAAVICRDCGDVKQAQDIIPKLPHKYENIIYIYNGADIKLDAYGNKVSEQHACINAEIGSENYHTENHQYKVTESVLPGKNNEYVLVYTYSCACGYSKIIPDTNQIVDENLALPTVMVSNGYATQGNSEVTVYVQLLNNPGVAGANFGIRYDSRLQLKEFSDGTVLSGSLAQDSHEVNFGYNFVWANAAYRYDNGNLLKLVFIVPEDAKLPTQTDPGDVFNISIVYDIENGATGGFSEAGKKGPQLYITRDGSITMVNRLPGDVNNDGVVDLLDAVEIGQFLVHKKDTIDEQYANVDLSRGGSDSDVNVSDMVAILQSITGGYGVNLLSQEFQVILNGNGFDLEKDTLFVSIYNEYNNTYKKAGLEELERKGYKFDGWWTKLVGGEQIILADGQFVKYFDYQKTQMLYAHWTLNTVTLDGNGNTNNIDVPQLGYTEDYKPGAVNTHYEQAYKVTFVDTSKVDKKTSVTNTLQYTLLGWALSEEAAGRGECTYLPDLSDLDLSSYNIGEITLYAVWDDGTLTCPTWDKQGIGYKPVQWYGDSDASKLLDLSDKDALHAYIKDIALAGNQEVKVYAEFTPLTYTIYYNANGGQGTKLPESNHNVESVQPLVENKTITRKGWGKFLGWALTPDAKEPQYYDTSSVGYIPTPDLQSDGTYALTLYAVWANPFEYKISYTGNGATSGTMASTNHVYDTPQALRTNSFDRRYTVTYHNNGSTSTATAIYKFAGWVSEYGVSYKNGQVVQNLTTSDTNITMTAQWTATSVTLPSLTRTGHAFGGWYLDSGCTKKAGNGGTTYTPTDNITLYAKWTPYTVTLDAAGGSCSTASISLNASAKYQNLPPTPARTNYAFVGWYYNDVKVKNGDLTKIDGNHTLTAKWTPAYYKVTLRSGGSEDDVTVTDDNFVADTILPGFDRELLKSLGYTKLKITVKIEMYEKNDGWQHIYLHSCTDKVIGNEKFEHGSGTYTHDFSFTVDINHGNTDCSVWVEWDASGNFEDDWVLGTTTYTVTAIKG